jgi:16S rRNA (cytosine967-C5)-methyltransferase
MNVSLEEKLLAALFLCSGQSNEILAALKPEWNKQVGLSLHEKLSIINDSLLIDEVFPWKEELSAGIDFEKYCASFLTQPDLFLRLRPGKEETVKEKLHKAGIDFRMVSDSCIALGNATKVDSVIELDKEAVVQDYSSQQVASFLPVRPGRSDRGPFRLWDCCAGSGGKSIMLFDMNPEIELTVSDIRESILSNLKTRFQNAGINNYKAAVLDLTKTPPIINNRHSIIIADLPCTGSGTWSRTPEQLYFFNDKKMNEYASLQKKIVSNVIPHLKPGGFLLYITCSVFRKENEEMVEYISKNFELQLLKMEVLKGYEKKADTLFAALLQKPL